MNEYVTDWINDTNCLCESSNRDSVHRYTLSGLLNIYQTSVRAPKRNLCPGTGLKALNCMAGFVASLPDRNRLTLLGGQEAMRWVRQSIPALMRVTVILAALKNWPIRNRDTDVENGPVNTAGEAEGGTDWEQHWHIHTPPCVKQIATGKSLCSPGSPARCSLMN